MNYKTLLAILIAITNFSSLRAAEYLIKTKTDRIDHQNLAKEIGGNLELVSLAGRLLKWTTENEIDMAAVAIHPDIEYIQKNHPIRLFANPSIIKARKIALNRAREFIFASGPAFEDNPEVKDPSFQGTGADPLLANSWGLHKISAVFAWAKTPKGKGIIVAVTDTGVDYNHQDLIHRMWRNPDEVANDGIDNDDNGFIDDLVGWDFAKNDNKPYDLSMSLFDILFKGGNPGHGTHVAGVVGASRNNRLGSAGVAPEVKIMAVRMISENGQGDTAGAIAAIDYSVKNGAHIISASWGSEGEEPGDMALREAIQRAEAKEILFIAAAGNGRMDTQSMQAKGYDNDADAKPVYPASYSYKNIIAVAALTPTDELASFSNFGKVTVDLGAPGTKILSTVPGDRYQDTIIDLGQIKATWDGTSMATPFVSGAAAVIWSQDHSLDGNAVKIKVLSQVKSVPSLVSSVLTGGRLDMKGLLPR